MAKYDYWITKERLLLVEGWARDGLTDEQIAKNIGIAVSTLNDWKKRFPEFSESLKRGKEVVDRMVENAMLKEILGYEYTEEVALQSGEVRAVRKFARPNPTLTIFWLKNRKPAEWRDKQEHQISGESTVKFEYDFGDDDGEDN